MSDHVLLAPWQRHQTGSVAAVLTDGEQIFNSWLHFLSKTFKSKLQPDWNWENLNDWNGHKVKLSHDRQHFAFSPNSLTKKQIYKKQTDSFHIHITVYQLNTD